MKLVKRISERNTHVQKNFLSKCTFGNVYLKPKIRGLKGIMMFDQSEDFEEEFGEP